MYSRKVLFLSVSLSLPVVFGASGTLKLVNLVYRHGDRSPVTSYPNNPTPKTTWPEGLGWLTEEGERMHYSLGRFFRRRYDGFLSREYSHTEISVESSAKDRCLMSAYSNLAGLYPPSGDQVWNKNITWQPIPVHSRPEEEDNMIAILKPCAKYDQIYYASLKSERVVNIEKENKELLDFLSEKSGISLNIDNLWIISDTVFCEKQHNVSLPPWINDTTYKELRHLESWGWDLLYREKEESRLKGGPLLKEWIRVAKQKMEDNTYTTRMNMYSAHDSTVIAVLSALGLYKGLIPPYTTTLFMELHQNSSGDFYVELYLRTNVSQNPNDDTQPDPLTLPGCEFQCPYHQFVTLTKDSVPVDWDAECAIETDNSNDINFKTAFIITVVVYSVVTLCLILVAMVMWFRRSHTRGMEMT